MDTIFPFRFTSSTAPNPLECGAEPPLCHPTLLHSAASPRIQILPLHHPPLPPMASRPRRTIPQSGMVFLRPLLHAAALAPLASPNPKTSTSVIQKPLQRLKDPSSPSVSTPPNANSRRPLAPPSLDHVTTSHDLPTHPTVIQSPIHRAKDLSSSSIAAPSTLQPHSHYGSPPICFTSLYFCGNVCPGPSSSSTSNAHANRPSPPGRRTLHPRHSAAPRHRPPPSPTSNCKAGSSQPLDPAPCNFGARHF